MNEKGKKREEERSSIEDIVWEEHCRGHYGPEKVYHMLRMGAIALQFRGVGK